MRRAARQLRRPELFRPGWWRRNQIRRAGDAAVAVCQPAPRAKAASL